MLYRQHGHTIKSLSRVDTFATTLVAEEHGTCRTCRKMKDIQEGYDLLVRGGNAVARCSSMWADILRGEYYCGNLLWQSGLTLLFSIDEECICFKLCQHGSLVYGGGECGFSGIEQVSGKKTKCKRDAV